MTPEEQAAVASLSSRVQLHPRRAVFVYNYGDFRGDPEQVLAQYYDAMFYLANWGSRHLLFRFPAALVDAEALAQYSVATTAAPSEVVTVETVGDTVIVGIRLDEEEGFGWVEGEGWLDRLLGIREALLQGDTRALYLAWLKGITLEYDVDFEALEPPVPPGLKELTPALLAFVELFDVNDRLLTMAAERSARLKPVIVGEAQLRQAIAALPSEEKMRSCCVWHRTSHDYPWHCGNGWVYRAWRLCTMSASARAARWERCWHLRATTWKVSIPDLLTAAGIRAGGLSPRYTLQQYLSMSEATGDGEGCPHRLPGYHDLGTGRLVERIEQGASALRGIVNGFYLALIRQFVAQIVITLVLVRQYDPRSLSCLWAWSSCCPPLPVP